MLKFRSNATSRATASAAGTTSHPNHGRGGYCTMLVNAKNTAITPAVNGIKVNVTSRFMT
jgi:hypothetical protein